MSGFREGSSIIHTPFKLSCITLIMITPNWRLAYLFNILQMHWEEEISMSEHAIPEKRPWNALNEEDAGYWRFDISKSIVDAANDSILEEGGSAGEGFGSETTEEISIIDDRDGKLDDYP
jgi:hypothetical protein